MGYSPAAITALYPILKKYYPSTAESGVYADKPGYHNSRNELRQDNRWSDYSIQIDLDLLGDGDAGSAIDARMNTADLGKLTRRMLDASKARDPRLVKVLREWFASLDGDGVDGWSLYRDRFASSDDSHEWHFHGSGWRKYVNDEIAWLGVAEVMCGLAPGTLAKPVYLPVYLVDPAKVSTTLTANAPAGKEDRQRPPLYPITTGVRIVTEGGRDWLVTESDYSYALDFLILKSEYENQDEYLPPYVVKAEGAWEIDIPSGELLVKRLAGYRIADAIEIRDMANGQWLIRDAVDGRANLHRLHLPKLTLESKPKEEN
jgi:hypothetical protein